VVKLFEVQERRSSDQGFLEEEEVYMVASRRCADDIQNVASQISCKMARLVDNVDHPVFRLRDEEEQD